MNKCSLQYGDTLHTELEYGNVGFRIKDDNQQQTQTRSTWWEASALTTASPQLPVNNVHLNHLWKRFTTPKYQPKFIGLTHLEVGRGIMGSLENPRFRCLFCRLASLSPRFLFPSLSLITSSLLENTSVHICFANLQLIDSIDHSVD